MRRTRAEIHLFRVAALAVLAAIPLSRAGHAQNDSVPVEFKAAPLTVAPGGSAEAQVTIVIHKDYRLIAEPAPHKYSTALMVSFDASKTLHPLGAILPPSRVFKEKGDFSYSAYEGTIVVKVPVKADRGAAPGDYTLHGRARYQPLIIDNNLAGFLKTTVKLVDVTVHVAAPKAK